MNIELNTSNKVITLKDKVSLDELLDFLYESNIEFDDWSLDFPKNNLSVPVYPFQGGICGNTTVTNLANVNSSFTKN